MRSLDLPQILYQPFAATGDKNTILDSPSTISPQRASLQAGFPPITQIPIANGGIPPERMDFNGLGYLLSSFYFFTQCGGVYTFNRNVSNAIGGYPLGAVLYYTDSNGTTYKVRSLLENNTFDFVTTPSYIDDKHWAYVSSTPITQDTSASSTSNVFSTAAVQSLISNTLNSIYPVGSIYIGTQNTCPLASLISGSQWKLVSTSLITDINNTASVNVYGNGNALGFTDGNKYYALAARNNYKDNELFSEANGNIPIGQVYTPSRWAPENGITLGIVQDGTKSGIVGTANISSTKLTVNVWRRTA